ncbi:large-conductance mechanosensitive channel protein MscL [Pseudonocardia sp. NPDC046786]|uniref:large-conductance mechanosensitive channel protein MscL n=1 Tax=Pseudonocardia sp. NPDC046786 TaxID=3155471 RepID=UPI00340BA217
MLKGFKEFLLRGNVIDLAVAVVIGAAFTAVVTAFTTSFLEPLLRLFSGGENAVPPGTIPLTDEVRLDYAAFLNAMIQFMITAAVIYFLVVFPMKWLQERRKKADEQTPKTDSELLAEIRDLLKEQAERERERALAATATATAAPAPAGPWPPHGQPVPQGQPAPQAQPVPPGRPAAPYPPDAPRRSRHRG